VTIYRGRCRYLDGVRGGVDKLQVRGETGRSSDDRSECLDERRQRAVGDRRAVVGRATPQPRRASSSLSSLRRVDVTPAAARVVERVDEPSQRRRRLTHATLYHAPAAPSVVINVHCLRPIVGEN